MIFVIFIGIMLSVFQQFVGINVVLYYAGNIFRNMGASTNASLLQTIFVGTVNLTFTVVAILTVDKFGRKPLMIIGALGMAVSMIGLGFSFSTHNEGVFALILMLTYVASLPVWDLSHGFCFQRSSRTASAVPCQLHFSTMACKLARINNFPDTERQPETDRTV